MKNLKLTMLVLVMAILAVGVTFAQKNANVTSDVHAEKGNIAAFGGIGYGWGGFGISGGAEYIFQKFDIPGFPLSLGAMGIAGIDFGSGVAVSAAGMATLHWGLKAYKDFPEFLQKFDSYIGLGVGMGIVPLGVGISSGGGLSYYLNEQLAIDVHSFYVHKFVGTGTGFGSTLGVRYKIK